MPGDGKRLLLTVLLAAWVLAFGYAFYGVWYDRLFGGIAGNMGPVTHFVGWQGVASVLAFAVFGVSRDWPKGSGLRVMCAVPMVFAILLLAGVLFVAWQGPPQIGAFGK